jgi:hypothetical protein
MAGTVWSKFFWSDWSNDPALRICSLAAQGLWMRMLCIAAEADPTGYVTVNGRPLGVTDIARLAGVTETECESLLAELDRNGVFSRDRKGATYSRRMVRDAKTVKKNRENGKKGGNPSIGKDEGISGWVNPPVKGGVKPHKPVAICQKPESSSTARARSPVTGQHRAMALDLLDRGKASLTPWERNFLEDLCRKSTITPRIEDRLAEIGNKIGFNANELMATWQKRLAAARDMRQWDPKWGPMPGELGCLAPQQLLEASDGNGWTEWRPAS